MFSRPLVYYVSGHGLGHASRACQVIGALPKGVPVIMKSMASAEFFRRESGRPDLEVIPARYDIGAVQESNRVIDWDETVSRAAALEGEAARLCTVEVDFLKEVNARGVVCDVPPLPLLAAREAGLPCCLVANFTWIDIYKAQLSAYPQLSGILQQYRTMYQAASLSLLTPLGFPMRYLRNREAIPLIARTGKNVRRALRQELRVSRGCKLVLLYLGDWGDRSLDWSRIQAESEGITYVAFSPMPAPVQRLNAGQWHFPDVVASVDAVLAKPGYGTAGECMANGTPLVYYPRPEFAEYPVLHAGLKTWGGGMCISQRRFASGRWKEPLEHAFTMEPARAESNGAAVAAERIVELCGTSS